MPRNSEIIISDTSCLIILSKIDELDFLRRIGDKIYITPTIRKEFGKKLPEWILQSGILTTIRPVLDKIKNTDFRFSEALFEIVLKEAGE